MTTDPPLTVKVWSDLACFTRPEFCAERVSKGFLKDIAD